jgi:hypothetical protein
MFYSANASFELKYLEVGVLVGLIHARLLQVCRGTAVMLVAPTDGTEEIANPFLAADQPPASWSVS